MSEHETEEPQVEEGLGQEETVVQPDSIMETLRQKHKELKDSKTLDLPVPGYDGMLVAKYRLIGVKELEVIGNKVQREFKGQGDRVTYASVDALIAACDGLYYNRDGRLVGLHESISKTEPDIKFDDRLVQFLGLDISDEGMAEILPDGMRDLDRMGEARRTVLALFGGNDIAILDHSRAIGQWSSDTSRDVSEAFLARS